MYLLHGLCPEDCLLEWCCVRRTWQPSHGSGGQSPASHRGESSSVLRQSVWELWWTEWHWDKFLCKYFRCSLLEPCCRCSILIGYRVRCSSWQWTASQSNTFKKDSYLWASSFRRFEISVVRLYSGSDSRFAVLGLLDPAWPECQPIRTEKRRTSRTEFRGEY